MIFFTLTVVFILLTAVYVAKATGQDLSVTFLILLLLFSGLTFKRQMNRDLKMLNKDVEISSGKQGIGSDRKL